MSGTNHDEWRLFVAFQYDLEGTPLTDAEYPAAVAAFLRLPVSDPFVQLVLNVYPLSNYPPPPGYFVSAPLALGALGTDDLFVCTSRNADLSLSKYVPTYTYEFNDENAPPQPPPAGLSFPLGAFHSAELQYLFDVGYFQELNAAQLQLSAAMVGYWTNFAVSGDPNGGTLPTWSLYDPMIDQFESLIQPTPVVESTFNTDHQCDTFWNLIP